RIPVEKQTGSEVPLGDSPSGWAWQNQQPYLIDDLDQETRFPPFIERLRGHNVRSMAIIPLTTAQHRLGALCFGHTVAQRIADTELQFMQRVASQVAVAVDNALNLETSQAYQKRSEERRVGKGAERG